MIRKIFILLCLSSTAFGQLNDQAYLLEYKKAVQLFADSKYDLAGQKFQQLCSKSYSNPMVPYAYFYNALNSKNKGNNYQSRVIFRQLFENYYDWDKINEARIIYSELNFAENYFEEGLKAMDQILDPGFESLKVSILKNYIPKVKSISTLKDLYFKFPNQEVIASNLVDKIQANRYISKDDLELSDMLTNRFKLKEIKNKPNAPKEGNGTFNKSGQINIAALLPFNISGATENAVTGSNKYVFDLYEGMKLAAEDLKLSGIDVNLHAFDVKKSKYDFLVLEKKEGFKNIDVFVGPLYPEPNESATDFAQIHKVIQIHPLSNNLSLLKDGRNIYLLQPSHLQQSKKTIEYVESLNLKKTVSIYFGSAKKDSIFASIYMAEAIKKGYKITTFKKFSGNLQKLSPENGHVFLAADNNFGVKFLQSISYSKIQSEVICTAASFNWDRISTNNFTEKVSVIYPEFVKNSREEVKNFDKKYLEKMSGLPSYYSYAGYDLVLFFGRMLKDGKDIFKLNIDGGSYTDDYLLSGFDYSGKIKENAIVPIIKYKGEEFEEIFR